MLQNNRLVIYPTSRAIRANLKSDLSIDSMLPKRITIGDFEKKVLLAKGRTFIDEDTRILLLKEASQFSTFKNLHIDREFFVFLKNAKFLFGFFEELAVELIEIDTLKNADVYASYGEHLEILETLQAKYLSLLDEHHYCDKILLPKIYELNHSYLESLDEIELYLEGYLNNFEFAFFIEIAKNKKVIIDLHTNAFNEKMRLKFESLGFSLKTGYHYKLNLSTIMIESENISNHTKTTYQTFSSNSRILQTAYIKKSVHDLMKQGIKAEDIVVVLPNSSFADLLSLFNEENYFNFAMGESFKKRPLYQEISALYEYAQERSLENIFRLKRLGFEREKVDERIKSWDERMDVTQLQELLELFVEGKEGEAVDIYFKELHLFSKLFPTFKNYPFKKVLHLFLNRLATCSLDDVNGGKVTVMEVLETRGVTFEGVIVVDFNEGVVPARSQKDLFLSTEIRYLAGLPTAMDRENLQKYYYKRLFEKAKNVHISYVEDEQNQPTRFLDELSIESNYHDKRVEDYHDILFTNSKQPSHFLPEDIEIEYDFTQVELSATRLKTYLDCKRRYYFRYIRQLEEATIPTDESTERLVGIFIHKVLDELYGKKDAYIDEDALYLDLQRELYIKSEEDLVLRFYVDIWLEKLKSFCQNEVERFRMGYKVAHREEPLTCLYKGMKLKGSIDRIDSYHDKLYIIDYKTGKIPKSSKKSLESESNFQLQFYYILATQLGEVGDVHYYDLARGKIVDEALFDEKMLMLEKHLEALKEKKQNFQMTDDHKKCEYCPYIKICDRIG
jgi:RecB family exonuclease